MKKYLIMLIGIAISQALTAQLKVNATGKVGIGGAIPSSSKALSVSGSIIASSIDAQSIGSPYSETTTNKLTIFGSNYQSLNLTCTSTGLNMSF
jgi:hypothetical protein